MENRKVNKIIKPEKMENYLFSYEYFYLHQKYSSLLRIKNVDRHISYLSSHGLVLENKCVPILGAKTYLYSIFGDINNAIVNFSYKNDLSFLSNNIKDDCYNLIQIKIKEGITIDQLIKHCKWRVFS